MSSGPAQPQSSKIYLPESRSTTEQAKVNPVSSSTHRIHRGHSQLYASQSFPPGVQIPNNVKPDYGYSTARLCLRPLGHMAVCTCVVQHSRLRLHPLQTWLASVLRPNRHKLDCVVTVPQSVQSSPKWWTDPHFMLQRVPFAVFSPTVTLVSDASELGWWGRTSMISVCRVFGHKRTVPSI